MTTTLWLRIASVISLLFTVGHTMGGLKRWSPMGDNDVLRQMTAVRFYTMGASRCGPQIFRSFRKWRDFNGLVESSQIAYRAQR